MGRNESFSRTPGTERQFWKIEALLSQRQHEAIILIMKSQSRNPASRKLEQLL